MRWRWPSVYDALEVLIVEQDKRIKALEDTALEHEKRFEELRIRLSNSEDWTKPQALVKDTDWLERRKQLTAQYAEEKKSAK